MDMPDPCWTKKVWPKRSIEERRESGLRQAERVKYMARLGREPEHYDEVLFRKWYEHNKGVKNAN